ncbi:MAG: hypothetical protein ACK5LX_00970 [Oscillospiraceae bacterium]
MLLCEACNGRVSYGECVDCWGTEVYSTEGVTREAVRSYLHRTSWERVVFKVYSGFRTTIEHWVKAGYDYRLCFGWRDKIVSLDDCVLDEDNILRALSVISDAEGRSMEEVAAQIAGEGVT